MPQCHPMYHAAPRAGIAFMILTPSPSWFAVHAHSPNEISLPRQPPKSPSPPSHAANPIRAIRCRTAPRPGEPLYASVPNPCTRPFHSCREMEASAQLTAHSPTPPAAQRTQAVSDFALRRHSRGVGVNCNSGHSLPKGTFLQTRGLVLEIDESTVRFDRPDSPGPVSPTLPLGRGH
jgi:hypothetical protein